MSAVLSSVPGAAVSYGTTLLSRKSRIAPVVMAKLMFSGIVPV
jgi:hypothetical protein